VINLYAKIFIGFWLSMIAIIASWMLAGEYFSPFPGSAQERDFDSETSRDRRFGDPRDNGRRSTKNRKHHPMERPRQPGPPGAGSMQTPREMFRILYALQNTPEDELPQWIKQQEENSRLKIFLIDASGKDIFSRELVPGTTRVLEKLDGFRRRTAHREGKLSLFGQEVYRQERGQLTAVVASYPPASPIIKALTEHLWLRLLLAILISGLISYAVSRYLTRPLKQLQLASRKLASGELETRIEVPATGGDETDELARDFNTMAEQLQRQMQAQRRLLRDVSHELRSPLARLRVALALAEKEPQRQGAQLQRIERETERLDELIGQLLAVPEGKIELEDSLDLVILIQELCADASFEAAEENKSIVYRTELAEAVVKTRGDLLKKALENVIRNALSYTAAGTSVLVELEASGAQFCVAVTDQGPGIPDNALERIFEPFYRVDDARQRETGGYGLGLSIASNSIKQHGGSIRAQNTGSGLRVLITLEY
jgi:signal transduction histidine kinase